MKIKLVSLFIATLCVVAPFAQAQDKSVHHAAMHAEHWVNHHSSAPHRKNYHKPKHQDKSTHHAAMHAEHWLNHHLSAPHKDKGHS